VCATCSSRDGTTGYTAGPWSPMPSRWPPLPCPRARCLPQQASTPTLGCPAWKATSSTHRELAVTRELLVLVAVVATVVVVTVVVVV